MAIPDDTFVTYITDPDPSIANLTRAAYEMTEGECVQYIELGSTSSHYSINDWNLATAPHQVHVSKKEREENFTHFSDHDGSLLRRQFGLSPP